MSAPETEPESQEPTEPEAEEVEGEEQEAETEEGEEPEAEEGEPEEPQARAPSAAELRRFEAENTRHEKRLAEIMGDDFQHFAACPACGGVGFTPAALVLEPEFVDMPGVIECPGCKGHGRLRMPTRVPGQELQTCPDCAGNGWKREAAPALATAEPYAPGAPAPGNGAPLAPPGYILVQVDPNAAPLPPAPPAQAVAPPSV